MNDSQIRELILGLVMHLDYELYHDLTIDDGSLSPEGSEELRDLFKELKSVVKTHLTGAGIKICDKCNGTGWYSYDHNHSKICEKCCTHSEGWWEITKHHHGFVEGGDNRCCRNGCGTMARDTITRTKY